MLSDGGRHIFTRPFVGLFTYTDTGAITINLGGTMGSEPREGPLTFGNVLDKREDPHFYLRHNWGLSKICAL